MFNGVSTLAKSDAILQTRRKISTTFWLGKAKLCSVCARYEGTEDGREGIVPLIRNRGIG